MYLYKMMRFSSYTLDALAKNSVFLSHPEQFNDPLDAAMRLSSDDEEMLQKISDFLILEEAKDELDEYEFSKNSLVWRWGRYTNIKVDKEGSMDFKIEDPHFSDLFYNALKYVSKKELFVKQLKEKAVLLNNKGLHKFLDMYEKMGICSFSKTIKDIQMWAYYADNHKGFCVEYEVDEEEVKKNAFLLKDVIYKEDRPEALVSRDDIDQEKLIEQIRTKSHLWSHENEVRLISLNESKKLVKFPGKVKSITFGIHMPAHEQLIVKDLISSKVPGIEYYLAQVSHDIYTVHRRPIDSSHPFWR